MGLVKLMFLRFLPWITRYFHVGKVGADRLEPGIATMIRRRGWKYSYLYLDVGDGPASNYEPVPETPFFWGSWLSGNMVKGGKYPMKREIDELEAFVLIRRAAACLYECTEFEVITK